MTKNYSQGFAICEYGKPNLVAGVFSDVRGGEAVAEANARLIAAAPDLLEALVALDAWWTSEWPQGPDAPHDPVINLSDDTIALWRQIRAAIARAEGR